MHQKQWLKLNIFYAYRDVGSANYWALGTFKQHLALKVRVRCGISIALL